MELWLRLNFTIKLGEKSWIEGAKERIKRTENEINAYKGKVEDITIGEVKQLSEFINSSQYENYKKKATSLLLNGGYVPEMYFAGAATRFI